MAAAAELLGVLRDHGGRPADHVGAGVASRARPRRRGRATDPLSTSSEWYGLVELAGPAGADVAAPLEAALGDAVEAGLVLDAAIAGSPAQRSGLWALRERVSEAQEVHGPTVKHDVSVPITALADFVARTGPASRRTCPAPGSSSTATWATATCTTTCRGPST